MQRVQFSAGKALCRFCGEYVATNNLSLHIAKEHPRPGQIDKSPTLVRKRQVSSERDVDSSRFESELKTK
jgi:hypothetical protein